MKFRGTFVLAALAVLMGLYIYFVEIKKAQKDEESKTAAEKVLSLEAGDAREMTITNSSGEVKVESKDGTHWTMSSPVTDNGDDENIRSTINSLTGEKFEDTVENEDPKNFGLDKSKATVTIKDKAGQVHLVKTGIEAPLPGKVYLQRGDEKKFLLANASFKNQLDKTAKDFRQKDLFRKDKADVKHVIIKDNSKDGHYSVKLDKLDNNWMIGPRGEKADGDIVNAFTAAVEGLRAQDFVSEKADAPADLKKHGLDKPEIQVTLEGDKDAVLADMYFSPKTNNNIYARVGGVNTIYQLFPSGVDALHHKYADFKDKRGPFEFKKDDATDIELKTSLVDFHLVKKDKDWQLAKNDPHKVISQIQVTNLLDKLASLRVGEFLDQKEKPRGMSPPLGHIQLKDNKGSVIFAMDWGEKTKSAKAFFSKTDKSEGLVGVDAGMIESLPGQTLVEEKNTSPTPAPEVKTFTHPQTPLPPHTTETSEKPQLPHVEGPPGAGH